MRLVLVLVLVACGSSSTPPAKQVTPTPPPPAPCVLATQDKDIVHGRIVDSVTREPLVGATIAVDEDLPEDRQSYEAGIADDNGCFAFAAKQTGAIHVHAYYADVDKVIATERKAGVPLALDIELYLAYPDSAPAR